jgi:hypothetical protein
MAGIIILLAHRRVARQVDISLLLDDRVLFSFPVLVVAFWIVMILDRRDIGI